MFQTFAMLTESQREYLSSLISPSFRMSWRRQNLRLLCQTLSEEQNIYPYPCMDVCVNTYTHVHIYVAWRDCEAPQSTVYKTGEQTKLVMWFRPSSDHRGGADGEITGVSPRVWDPGSLRLMGRKHGCPCWSRKSRSILVFVQQMGWQKQPHRHSLK